MNILRPHDVAVALQLVLSPGMTYPAIARALRLSLGESHNAVRRLIAARLVRKDERAVNRAALLEFLTGGVPYAFAVEPGPVTRGVPTAHSAPPLNAEFDAADAFVWPSAEGQRRGSSVEPLWPGAPEVADTDERLYRLLAVVDALRVGRARERQRARKYLQDMLKPPADVSPEA